MLTSKEWNQVSMKATTTSFKSIISIGALTIASITLWVNTGPESLRFVDSSRGLARYPLFNFCKCLFGNCPPKDPPPQDDPSNIIEKFRDSVPEITLQVIPPKLFDIVSEDTPNGFVAGWMKLADGGQEVYSSQYGKISVEGLFERDDGKPVDQGAIAKIYLSDGSSFTASIDSTTGKFQFKMSEVQPGRAPALITFPQKRNTSRALNSNSALTPRRQLVDRTGWLKTPALIWCNNDDMCPAALSFTLTWNTPNSDLDLHVSEPGPSGKHVYFAQQVGTFGILDRDDFEGYGPENYFSLEAPSGNVFMASIHCSETEGDALPQGFTLVGRTGGKVLWTTKGQLKKCDVSDNVNWSTDEDWSAKYNLTSTNDIAVCRKCHQISDELDRLPFPVPSEISPKQTNQVRRKLSVFDANPPKCESCLNQYLGLLTWRYETEEWKLQKALQTAKNNGSLNKATVAFWYTTLLAPLTTNEASETIFWKFRNQIVDQSLTTAKLQCAMYHIMQTLCGSQSLKKSTEYIAGLLSIASVQQHINSLSASGFNNFTTVENTVRVALGDKFSYRSTEAMMQAYSRVVGNPIFFTQLEKDLTTTCGFPTK